MLPLLPIVASKCTEPSSCKRNAFPGYVGCTFLTINPCETPCETVRVCNTGVEVVETLMRFGSALAELSAETMTLGADVSAVTFFATLGRLPFFTKRVSAPDLSESVEVPSEALLGLLVG